MLKPILTSLLVLLLSAPVVLLILAIDKDPSAAPDATPSQARTDEIQQLLIDKDPRRALQHQTQTLHLTEAEVNALLNYSLDNISQLNKLSGKVDIQPGEARISLSFMIPENPFGQYINLGLTLSPAGNSLTVQSLELGSLNIPGALFGPLLDVGQDYFQKDNKLLFLNTLAEAVEKVSLHEHALDLTFNWESQRLDKLREQAQQLFISDQEKERLRRYYARIGEISWSFPADQRRVALNDFLQPLFLTALDNSRKGENPSDENRALLLAMTIYLTDLELSDFTGPGEPDQSPAPRTLDVRIESRRDLAQHIVASAAISASAGAGIADLLSIYKEVYDSRYETGFSFSDLTASQVGTSLGRLASQNHSSALALQKLMSAATSDSDYMPPVGKMDGITEQEFLSQYGSRTSAEYQQRLVEISAGIQSRPVFQALADQIEFQSVETLPTP
ncbi:MAG: hypothetical protein RQ899_06640 [Pseudomonadales bacterium]|nr:hypothetical protein [Pseudomonadales bacterium]